MLETQKEEKDDKKGTYITLFMLIMLAILFFAIGYGYAAKSQILDCNAFIEQEILPNCPFINGFNKNITPQLNGGENEEIKRFGYFNLTQD